MNPELVVTTTTTATLLAAIINCNHNLICNTAKFGHGNLIINFGYGLLQYCKSGKPYKDIMNNYRYQFRFF